jgi:hypothetical protein
MGHLTHMVDDQYDYYLYSMRKFTLNAFEGLMKFNDGALYRFKPIIKATGDLIRLVSRVDKNKAAEVVSFKQIYDDYLKSEKYLKLKLEIETAVVDEEEYKKDQDPEGYHRYNDLVSHKHGVITLFSFLESTMLTLLYQELPGSIPTQLRFKLRL